MSYISYNSYIGDVDNIIKNFCYLEKLKEHRKNSERKITGGDPRKFIRISPEAIVHYCSLESFKCFVDDFLNGKRITREIDGKNVELAYLTFFATHIRYLNDEQEFKEGKSILKDINGGKDPDINDEIYVACFSDSADNLTQWKYYGSDCGIAIEFETDKVFLNYCDVDENKDYEDCDVEFCPIEVMYENHFEKAKALKETDKLSLSGDKVSQSIIPYLKNGYFKDERESRIVLYNIIDSEGNPLSQSLYRVSGGILKPYIKMKIFQKRENKDFLPIKSVTVGPGNNADKVCNAICQMLETPFYCYKQRFVDDIDNTCKADGHYTDDMRKLVYKTSTGIEVYKSAAPFRSK